LGGLPEVNPDTIVGNESLPVALAQMNGMIAGFCNGSFIMLNSFVVDESGGVISSSDSMLTALSKLQNQITAMEIRLSALEI
jgi:hypothetical protein